MNDAQFEERFRNLKIAVEKFIRKLEKQDEERKEVGMIDRKIPIEPECQD